MLLTFSIFCSSLKPHFFDFKNQLVLRGMQFRIDGVSTVGYCIDWKIDLAFKGLS